ncbi:MAG TPA: UDP-N-acetylmuramate--L-alanine ligase, partial [Actinomycetota bacterium]|nr:UDP-N-acetylmuramate--L-alanine ligase [Actinomycetota bacterium]
MTIAEAAHIHFVGIGGAGMSAIALVLLERGRPVSGSDAKEGPALDLLRARGAEVVVGHDADNVSGADQVVVSNAVPAENVEVQRAHSTGARVITRGEALAELLAPTSAVIVAGTHGKTTTAAMIVAIAKAAGLDPTYLIGAGFGEDHTNAHSGRDDLAVAESDESDGSFLLLAPKIGVVTNVDADHLDHWASEAEYRRAFVDFVDRIREDGSLVAPSAEGDLLARGTESGLNLVSFGPDGDIRAGGVTYEATGSRFTVRLPSEELEVNLRVPGAHNIENALAATGAAVVLGIESEAIKRGLETYRGVDRRFQLRGSPGGRMVVDDYAHHPVEVRAV